ncbi:hypothetical protein [Lysobacter sp. P5_B9]
MDFRIWDAGVFHFNSVPHIKRGAPPPHELDYLHGFHNVQTLTEIQQFITAQLHADIRITSVWLDKAQYVAPVDMSSSSRSGALLEQRELCDLAVIVRRSVGDKHERSMWLLQVKKLSSPIASLPTDHSTKKEVELLEACPPFEFLAQPPSPIFDLSSDFGRIPGNYRHWSFLAAYDYGYCPPYVGALPLRCPHPWQWRWMGRGTPWHSGSFSEQLLGMCAGVPGAFGVRIDEPANYPEWHRLAVQMLRFGRTRRHSKAARGRHVLNLSAYLPSVGVGHGPSSLLNGPVGIEFSGHAPRFGASLKGCPIKTTGFQFLDATAAALAQAKCEEFVTAEHAAEMHYGFNETGEEQGPPNEPPQSTGEGDGEGGGGAKCTLILDVVKDAG